ncbi:MAG: VacB/RNase II family 3'-5' exoribonuclease [Planctomycetota bacterium]
MSDFNTTLANRIIEYMKSPGYRAVKRRHLGLILGLTAGDEDYEEFKLTLSRLVSQGRVAKLRGNRFDLVERSSNIVGRLTIRGTNYGFVKREGGKGIVEIRRGNFGGAMHGDVVEVELLSVGGPDANPTGRVVKVVSSGDRMAVGTLIETREGFQFIPVRGGVYPEVPIDPVGSETLAHGDYVSVEFTKDRHGFPRGRVVEKLGNSSEYSSTIEAILRAFDVPGTFSPEAVEEADKIASMPLDIGGREDFTGLFTLTIDPEDAKDFDDALSIEQLEGGWRVYVHIADVSAAVPRGSLLDAVSRERGTSVYLPGFVVPMLPHSISNVRCCLSPGEPKLAKTVVLDYDLNGNRLDYRVVRSVVLSNRRLNYRQVLDLLSNPQGTAGAGEECDDTLRKLWAVASELRKKRFEQGSLLLDMPEVRITLDRAGKPVDLTAEYGDDAHSLVEEFMLEANRAVAELMLEKEIGAIHRIHDEPDDDMLANLKAVLTSFGVPVGRQLRRSDLCDIIEAVADKPYARVVNLSILRSMKMALYSEKATGHYALAFDKYLHFTSPIRRYPDLFVHQQLDRHYFKCAPITDDPDPIEDVAMHCSDTERNASDCERNIVQLKTLEYLSRFKGQEFEGVVTGVKDFGIVVELTRFLVDGLLHVREMGDEYFSLSSDGVKMFGDGGSSYVPGQVVMVKLAGVDLPRRRLELHPARKVEQEPLTIDQLLGKKAKKRAANSRTSPNRPKRPHRKRGGGSRRRR